MAEATQVACENIETTARNLLSRPPRRGRSEPGQASGSEGVWGEREVEKG